MFDISTFDFSTFDFQPIEVAPAAAAPRVDPGGHRRRLQLLQELDRQQRQRELDRRLDAVEAERSRLEHAEVEQRSPDERHEPQQPDQSEPELSASPLPMVANFGMGPVTIGIKQFPSLKNEILADDEAAIIAIILAAQ